LPPSDLQILQLEFVPWFSRQTIHQQPATLRQSTAAIDFIAPHAIHFRLELTTERRRQLYDSASHNLGFEDNCSAAATNLIAWALT